MLGRTGIIKINILRDIEVDINFINNKIFKENPY